MIVAYIDNTGRIAAPITISDSRFISLTNSQKQAYGFWPCELVNHVEGGSNLMLYPYYRRIDRVRALFRQDTPEQSPELAARNTAMNLELATYQAVIADEFALYADIHEALDAIQSSSVYLCQRLQEINTPEPEPEPEE